MAGKKTQARLIKNSGAKKGQVWTLDYIVGLLIFLVVIFTALTLLRNLSSEKDTYSETLRESEHIAAILLSEVSSEQNSTNSTNHAIITLNNRINNTILDNFDNLSYSKSKLYFQTNGEYVFYFYNGSVINQSKCFRGYNISEINCTINSSSLPPNAINIAKTERIVILNSQIIKLVVISWSY